MITGDLTTVYSAECDCCGEQFEHSFEGWSIFFDNSALVERMSDQGWHFGDGDEGEAGNIYCPDCYHVDDEDVFHINIISIGEDAFNQGQTS